MKIASGTFALVFLFLNGSLWALGEASTRQEKTPMQTIRLHVDGFMKSKSGAT